MANIKGTAGHDRLIGTGEADQIYGYGGNDTLDGAAGADTMVGGAGDDIYFVDDAADSVIESDGMGRDTIYASVSYTLANLHVEALILTGSAAIDATGNAGDNALTGNSGNNILTGLAGNDHLDGRGGADILDGGDGNDIYWLDSADDIVIEDSLHGGSDSVFASVSYSLTGGYVETLFLTGSQAFNATGNGLDNALVGNGLNNILLGLGGNDILDGGAGNDLLNGGGGNDIMGGGAGNDTYVVSSVSDTIFEYAADGIDSVRSYVDFTLGDNVENLQLLGTEAINGTGNNLANTIRGNSGANELRGLGGKDKLYGGAGDDILSGGSGNDWLEGGAGRDAFKGGAGADMFVFRDGDFAGLTSTTSDRITDFSQADLDKINLELVDANVILADDQAFNFVGTAGFSNTAGELRYEIVSGSTYVYGDTDGDGIADFMITLVGSHALTGGDFVI